jgi:plasmid stabilization system protein ParE
LSLGYSEHPEATQERLQAILYYHRAQAGRGEDVANRFRSAIADVVASPGSWPLFPGWEGEPQVRSRKVAVYPYRVVYYVRDEIVVVAYAHVKRRPGYWSARLDG